jgi:hypothetical protein
MPFMDICVRGEEVEEFASRIVGRLGDRDVFGEIDRKCV